MKKDTLASAITAAEFSVVSTLSGHGNHSHGAKAHGGIDLFDFTLMELYRLHKTDEEEIQEINKVFKTEKAGTYEFSGEVDSKPTKVNRSLDDRVDGFIGQQGILGKLSKELRDKIKTLGIPLESKKGLGYRIIGGLDLLKKEDIYDNLSTIVKPLVSNLEVLSTTTSTNTLARKNGCQN